MFPFSGKSALLTYLTQSHLQKEIDNFLKDVFISLQPLRFPELIHHKEVFAALEIEWYATHDTDKKETVLF